MKTYILSTALVMMAGAAFAADPIVLIPVMDKPMASTTMPARDACSGHVEAYLGGLTAMGGNDDIFLTGGGTGRANCTFSDTWNVEGDLFTDVVDIDGVDSSLYGGTAHLYWRDPSSYAFGVFGTLAEAELGAVETTRYSVGPEFQIYMDNVTLYGQAEFGQAEFDNPEFDIDFWSVRGEARYFATENVRLDAELGYRNYDDALDIFYAAAQANYRFDNTPYTVFGRYQYEDVNDGVLELDLHKFTAGLRISFGSDTLIEEDRYGASMNSYRSNSTAF